MLLNEETNKKYNPAWSSAFISYIVSEAGRAIGISPGFKFSQAHAHYVQDLVQGRVNAAFRAHKPGEYSPRVGDILHYGREGAKTFDYEEAKKRYVADAFYASHSDLVIEVDLAGKQLLTLGGNVRDSVSRKQIPIAANGLLLDRKEGGKTYPWIAVLEAIV